MIIQIADDFYLNTEQVNYIKGFKDLEDGKDKTYINFINKDSVVLPFDIVVIAEKLAEINDTIEGV